MANVERAATHIPDKGCGWQASASGMPDRATYIKRALVACIYASERGHVPNSLPHFAHVVYQYIRTRYKVDRSDTMHV